MSRRFHSRGFTLVEILVAITIGVILTAIALVSYSRARPRARDTRRRTDLEQIRTALEFYREENGVYPSENSCDSSRGSCGSACPCSGSDWSGAIVTALEPNFLANLPVDPINDTTRYYYYEPVCNQTSAACSISRACSGAGNCCAYELAAYLETTSSWYRVCSP